MHILVRCSPSHSPFWGAVAWIARGWEERLDESPLAIGKMNPAHVGMLCHPAIVWKSPLGLLGAIVQRVQVVLGECACDVVLRQISDCLVLDTSLGLP